MTRDYEVMPRNNFSRVARDMQCQLWFPLPSENVVLLRSGLLKHLDQHASLLFPSLGAPAPPVPTAAASPHTVPSPAADRAQNEPSLGPVEQSEAAAEVSNRAAPAALVQNGPTQALPSLSDSLPAAGSQPPAASAQALDAAPAGTEPIQSAGPTSEDAASAHPTSAPTVPLSETSAASLTEPAAMAIDGPADAHGNPQSAPVEALNDQTKLTGPQDPDSGLAADLVADAAPGRVSGDGPAGAQKPVVHAAAALPSDRAAGTPNDTRMAAEQLKEEQAQQLTEAQRAGGSDPDLRHDEKIGAGGVLKSNSNPIDSDSSQPLRQAPLPGKDGDAPMSEPAEPTSQDRARAAGHDRAASSVPTLATLANENADMGNLQASQPLHEGQMDPSEADPGSLLQAPAGSSIEDADVVMASAGEAGKSSEPPDWEAPVHLNADASSRDVDTSMADASEGTGNAQQQEAVSLSADAQALKQHWAQLKGQVDALRPVERFTVVSIAYRRYAKLSIFAPLLPAQLRNGGAAQGRLYPVICNEQA